MWLVVGVVVRSRSAWDPADSLGRSWAVGLAADLEADHQVEEAAMGEVAEAELGLAEELGQVRLGLDLP
jgi:hypothetical protein